ncbi:winged helix-turn-helix domain-containing protein [Intrasporangium sp. YIM S08009]|uniref:winged helix-turn-helix domain-containing protein n=1 Tax=Intrasporangium zincisolvens TaxID=3080018 RepID=UPI002B0622D7|nr:winged helix-turn-helix domain-containing protein [Intrasporangium sp. YIM S08009]
MFQHSIQAGFVLCVGLPLREATKVAQLLHDSAVVLVTSDLEAARTLLQPVGSDPALTDGPHPSHALALGPPLESGAPQTLPPPLAAGRLRIDVAAREVTLGGAPIHLSAKEFDLLALLGSDVGRVWSFAALTERIWGTDFLGDKEPLMSTVKRVRKRLGTDAGCQLTSVHGIGYRLRVTGP